jgi:hypothetical protein
VVVFGARVEHLRLDLRPPFLLCQIRHRLILSHRGQTSV